jgi:hypothetical protein
VDREQNRVKSPRTFVRYIPGVWLSRFFPTDLSSQLTDLTVVADGYWLYTTDSLWSQESVSKWNKLHDRPEAYWTALKQTNEELVHLSQSPESTERTIPSVYQSSFYYPDQGRLFRPQGLQHMLDVLTDEISAFQGNQPTYRGQTLFHCLNASNGTIRIAHVSLGKDTDPEISRSSEDKNTPIKYMLFDEKGNIFREGKIGPQDKLVELSLPTSQGRVTSLLIQSGVNGARAAISGLSCVIEASSTFPLETFQAEQQYAIYVSSHQAHLKFRAHCPLQESAVIIVPEPEQTNTKTLRITAFTEFRIDISSSPAQAFRTVTTARSPFAQFGDLRLYLYDYEFPYLFPLGKNRTP